MTDTNTEALIRPAAGAGPLADSDAIANLAVRDLAAARKYYEGVLGFAKVDEEGGELIVYRSGKTVFNLYRSDYAGTNKATAMTFPVGDRVAELAEALAAKGVKFEHYDMPGMRREGDVHIAGDMKVAWFKDPDGNILNIVSG
jgi:catechol 2,3-dioxygenase-like lactoylglutathione lyase family enzyme